MRDRLEDARVSRREWLAAALCLPPLTVWSGPGAAHWRTPARLGTTGLLVTPLGMGCEEAESPAVIRRAADLGINHFNVFAPAFDLRQLAVVGEALGPIRDRVVLATDADGQLRARRREAGKPGGVAPPGEQTTATALADLDVQLQALRTDYVDLWYLTSKRRPEEISDELLEAVRLARKAGKVRAAALSTHDLPAVLSRLVEVRDTIGAVMVTCNPASWRAAAAPIATLRAAGLGIVAMKSLMGGVNETTAARAGDDAGGTAERQRALAAAVRWVLRNPDVDTAPIGIKSLEQLHANVSAASRAASVGDAVRLEAEVDRMRRSYCHSCGACAESCARQLPVSDVLRALMYAQAYGDPQRGREAFAQLPPELRAVRCEACGTCTVRCPSGVRVRDGVARAQQLLA